MGITNTIAKLKAYFETWHKQADHSSITENITNVQNTVNGITNKFNETFYRQIQAYMGKFDALTDETNGTIVNIQNNINKKANKDISNWTKLTNVSGLTRYTKNVSTPGKCTLFINEGLKLAMVNLEFTYKYTASQSQKNEWVSMGKELPYKPVNSIKVPHSSATTVKFGQDGTIKCNATWDKSHDIAINVTAFYHYYID